MKILATLIATIIVALSAGCSQPGAAKPGVTPNPSAYIQNKGSDNMVVLALAWAERYLQEHSQVNLSVTGGGSGTGITSLPNGTWVVSPEAQQIVTDLGFVPNIQK